MTQDWKEEFDKKFASMYLLADERIIELNHNLLKGFISGLLKEERLAVLEEVEMLLQKAELIDEPSDLPTGFVDLEDISTIINNLRVK